MLFNKEQVLAICKDGRREIDIAKDYHVMRNNISNIKERRTYTRWTKDVEIVKFSQRKLNKEQHREIYLSKKPAKIFVENYNICLKTVSHIRQGRIYKDWLKEINEEGIKSPGKTRLNKQQHREIYLSEESTKVLAEKYNVCKRCIYGIRTELSHKSWAKEIEATPRKAKAKLNKQQHREIFLSEESDKILAEKYNVCLKAIYYIKTKTTHKSWANEIGATPRKVKARLNKQQHREIYLSKKSIKILAEKHNVAFTTIYDIRNKISHKS